MDHHRLDEIVDQALGLDPSEWTRFLDEQCGGDNELRAEAESLLSEHLGNPEALKLPSRPALDGPDRLPDRLGRYEILSELGRGGLGVVYAARDPRLGRVVALKVLPNRFSRDAEWRRRFRREAEVLAALNHPNIATVHSLERAGGVPFLTMERIEGRTLGEYFRDGPLSLRVSLSLGRQLANALDAGRKRGIIHCDLHPANVMVSPDGRLKVLDFGLAQWVDRMEKSADDSGTYGTPGYMSPERIEGRPIDHRTDIWSFGCLVYESLAGRPAFPGETPRARLETTLGSEPDWAGLPTQVSPRLRHSLERCLEKDPERRVHSIRIPRREIDHEWVRVTAPRAQKLVDAVRPHNLPAPVDAFVERPELSMVADALASARVITLLGLGGCGKTRLAIESAWRSLDRFAHGAWIVEIPPPSSDPQAVERAVATALGVRESTSGETIKAVDDYLREKEILLILDGCETHLAECAEFARRLSGEHPGVVVLATSRERFGIASEQLVRIPPLATPEDAAIETLRSNPAAKLLLERLARDAPDFRLTEDNAVAVYELCRRVDGIPLALELAAARASSLGVPEVLHRLRDRLDFLVSTRRDTPDRHRTLHALVDWSHSLLSVKEQLLFRRLSVFVGGWRAASAEVVCAREHPVPSAVVLRTDASPVSTDAASEAPDNDDLEEWEILDLLVRLTERSLVEVRRTAADTIRYRMLDTVAEFAEEKLRAAGEEAEFEARHRDHFIDWAIEVSGRLRGHEQSEAMEELDRDHQNLLRSLDACLEPGADPEPGLRVVGAIEPYWTVRGLWSFGTNYLGAFLSRCPGETVARGHALVFEGNRRLFRGEIEEATRHYEMARELAEKLGDTDLLARCVHNLGGAALHRNDLDEAARWFEAALEIDRRSGRPEYIAPCLSNLGLVAERQERYDDARRRYLEALQLARKAGNPHLIGILLTNVGGVAIQMENYDEAEPWIAESIRISRETDDRWTLAHALLQESHLSSQRACHDESAASAKEGIAIFWEIGHLLGVVRGLTRLGLVWLDAGEARRGTRLLGAASAASASTEGKAFTPRQQAAVDAQTQQAHVALGESEYKICWEAGRAASLGDAVREALGA